MFLQYYWGNNNQQAKQTTSSTFFLIACYCWYAEALLLMRLVRVQRYGFESDATQVSGRPSITIWLSETGMHNEKKLG